MEKNSLPTIYDVAKLAGVSIATVSRVLNSSERVSDASRRKVMAAIDTLKFIPKAEARARGLQNSGRIGVITPFFTSPSFTDRLRGVAAALANSRYELVVYTVDSVDRLNGYLASLPLTGNLDGLIIISLPIDEDTAQRLMASHLETVFIEYTHPGFSAITISDYEGGRLAAQHLIDHGHERCAYIYFSEIPPYSIHPEVQRLAGFRETLHTNGLSLPDEDIVYVPRKNIRDKIRALLTLPAPPTGLFVPSDDLALRVIHSAREMGWQTPQTISVVGFDDIEIAEHVDLTTISQRLTESGRMAVELLLARLEDPQRPIQQLQLPVTLERRATTRPFAETFTPVDARETGQ